MNSVLAAKIMARRQSNKSCDGLLRYLQTKSEKKFVKNMMSDCKNIEYFLTLWRDVKTLSKSDRIAMTNVLGVQIDLQNILWAYRLKKYYGIFGDTAYGFLIPIRHRLSKESFARIVSCKDASSLQSEVGATIYSNVFGDFIEPEQSLFNAVSLRYRKEGRFSHIALLCEHIYNFTQ